MTTATLFLDDMAKKTLPRPEPEPQDLPSETVRIAGDLMEAIRELCFHTRDSRGKRFKAAQLVDNYLRGPVLRDLERLRQQLAKGGPDKPG